jgi:hypothetical protein
MARAPFAPSRIARAARRRPPALRKIWVSPAERPRRLVPVRPLCSLALTLALVLTAPASRADEPEPGRALLTGALVFVAGFTAGGLLLATSKNDDVQDNVGWLTIEAAFAAAPIAAHATAGEWARALVFAAPPAAALAGTATLFAIDPAAIEHGALDEQRVLWAIFGIGLFSSAIGVVDSTFAGKRARAIAVAPVFGSGHLGRRIGVTL